MKHGIRQFRLDSNGLAVGEALTDFEGVMRGVAAYRGSGALLGDAIRGGALAT